MSQDKLYLEYLNWIHNYKYDVTDLKLCFKICSSNDLEMYPLNRIMSQDWFHLNWNTILNTGVKRRVAIWANMANQCL